MLDEKEARRFWAKVAVGGECWEWTASRDKDGYGYFSLHGKHDRAHKVSYREHVGPIPPGMCVLHTCDNPPCVNPAHLRLGTNKENSVDMQQKGRSARGVRNANSKFTESDVLAIRAARERGESLPSLGRRYGVTHQAILLIVQRKNWGWLT